MLGAARLGRREQMARQGEGNGVAAGARSQGAGARRAQAPPVLEGIGACQVVAVAEGDKSAQVGGRTCP